MILAWMVLQKSLKNLDLLPRWSPRKILEIIHNYSLDNPSKKSLNKHDYSLDGPLEEKKLKLKFR